MHGPRLCILVCDSFRHEIEAVARQLQAADVELFTFPARCPRPPLGWEELAPLVPAPARFHSIVLIGSFCLSEVAPSATPPHLRTVRLRSCFSLLLSDYALEKYQAEGGYLASSGWLADWQGRLAAMGLDAEGARELFAETAGEIVHLDTGVLETADDSLAAFSDRVGRPHRTVPVGLDLLRLRVEQIVEGWRQELLLGQERSALEEIRKRGANHDLEALEQSNRQLEERVRSRTAELECLLREQASFSYSVSHDLRAPLCLINSFSSIILEDYGESLPETARDYLERIRQSTRGMGQLIDSLLELARVSRAETEMKPVDLSELAKSAASLLQGGERSRRPALRIEEGVTATGDAALLRQVLFNLLGNAWKFTARHPSPLIEFGRTAVEGREAFFVRDNGVGFDMACSSNLFAPFERLHGHEFEGSGIGLATAQRVVKRHGGAIWAKAEVDRGATFYFTLPGSSAPSPLPPPPPPAP